MNTRLQVEHPVTELITGVDLVKEQINIANGEKLSFSQEDLSIRGHSVEVRVYAEDPENNFLPDTGNLQSYVRPQGAGVRVDDGYEEGLDVSIYYDPMIAKLITYGKDRQEAIDRMRRAISEYKITGVKTTLPFCDFVLTHKEFLDGSFTTKFVVSHYRPEALKKDPTEEESTIAALIASNILESRKPQVTTKSESSPVTKSTWKQRSRD